MEKLYKINDDSIEIILDLSLYPLKAIKKAVSNYTEIMYVKMSLISDSKIRLDLIIKDKEKEVSKDEIVGEFYNELFNESLRYEVSIETKNIRELIIGRALYTTCIDTDTENERTQNEEETEEKLDEYNINDIATNWFKNKEE